MVKKVIRQLRQFRKDINSTIPVSKLILFGSRAWGKPQKDSDIDLLIVSPSFRRKRPLRRGVELYKHWNLNLPVDFLCYTPEEFRRFQRELFLIKKVVEKGIEIK
ncbi:nucleotidyltransferase domain-containing protein [Candidatus Woesearchaeota archaeon]|nr:nucleotidyltransferase domain-containing protein [Candidatus Woesearchaeota archaeon]